MTVEMDDDYRHLAGRVNSYLFSALDDIKRAHDGVSNTAREDTSNHAFRVVAHVVYVAGHLALCG